MNWERVRGHWLLFSGLVHEVGARLLRNEAQAAGGRRHRQAGRLLVRSAEAHGAITRTLAAVERKLEQRPSRSDTSAR